MTPDVPKSSDYPWIGANDENYIRYMRDEWGVPVHDDRQLFEMLSLQVFQAGLTWAIILKRRESFRQAYAGFEVDRVARFTGRDIERLMKHDDLIRNRPKHEAVVGNAKVTLRLQAENGSFNNWLWQQVGNQPIVQHRHVRRWEDLPAQTEESRALSKRLRKEGFRFLGPVATYAFMQAVGLVDDRIDRFR